MSDDEDNKPSAIEPLDNHNTNNNQDNNNNNEGLNMDDFEETEDYEPMIQMVLINKSSKSSVASMMIY
jgi:hypothetical protein